MDQITTQASPCEGARNRRHRKALSVVFRTVLVLSVMPCAKTTEPSRGRGGSGLGGRGGGNVETRIVGRLHHIPHVTLFEFGKEQSIRFRL